MIPLIFALLLAVANGETCTLLVAVMFPYASRKPKVTQYSKVVVPGLFSPFGNLRGEEK